jgi:hypothetical protein
MADNRKSEKNKILRSNKGYLNPRFVKSITFYIISACLILSVIVCILAIWDYANTDSFWRMIATFSVIAVGSAVFAFINGIFGVDE